MHCPKILDGPFVYIILCVIGTLLYFKSFFFGFTYLDDHVLILNNLPALENFWYIFGSFTHGVFAAAQDTTLYYRPFLTISFIPEAIIGGGIAFFYHLVNVGIHLVVACLVYALFTQLNYSKRLSFLTALVFVVHPVLTQAVAWIPGRNDSLLAIFVLSSFIYFIDFVNERKQKAFLWSLFFFVLAIFTKETALMLPVLFVGYLWIRDALKKTMVLQCSAGWLLAITIWFSLRSFAMNHILPMSVRDIIGMFLENLPGTIQLLGKIFFPFNLSVLPTLQNTTFVFGYLAIALMVGLVLSQWREKQTSPRTYLMMLFGLVWFVLFLWPSFIRPNIAGGTPDFMEHRLYLPIIGILIFIAESYVGRALNTISQKCFLQISLLLLLLFSGITFVHENVFSNRLVFWQNAASHSPHSSLAQKNLGAMYYLDQNYPLAEVYTQKSLALNPEEPMAHNNLGLIYASRGQFVEAKQEYLQELSFNPYYDDAHYNLGLLYYQMNDFVNARKQWEQTLNINPDYTDASLALQTLNAERK